MERYVFRAADLLAHLLPVPYVFVVVGLVGFACALVPSHLLAHESKMTHTYTLRFRQQLLTSEAPRFALRVGSGSAVGV